MHVTWDVRARLWIAPLLAAIWLWLGVASAQAQSQFFDETDAAIGNQQICPGGNQNGDATANPNGWVNKSINVTSGPANAANMTIRLVADHTYRGDIRMDVRKQGTAAWTTVIVVSNEFDNNYNIEISSSGVDPINTGAAAGAHSTATTATPFSVNVGGTMNTFNTTAAIGTWEFRFCDNDYRDNGTILRLGLIFPDDGDLAVAASVDDPFPSAGGAVTATFTATNLGLVTITNAILDVTTSGDLTVDGTTVGTGTLTGNQWQISSLAPGATATLIYDTTLNSGVGTYSIARSSSSPADPVPGNDTDSAQAFVQPSSTAPDPLSCSVGEVYTMAWSETGTNSWPGGSLTQSYNAVDTDPGTADIPLTLTMSSPSGTPTTFFNGAVSTPSPRTRAGWAGGTGAAASLYVGLDFPDQSATSKVTMTMDLGIPAEGVEKFQFAITDIDQGTYRDRITVTGFAGALAAPTPTLIPGANVFVTGNQGISKITGNVAATSGDGNLWVTFNSPVDKIEFSYDNDPSANANPGAQAIALQDISICRRLLPDLEAAKTVEVYDPGSAGLLMTPGNEVLYTISVTNKGPVNAGTAEAAANDIDLSDTLPDTVRFVSATANNFTGGAFNTLPAANTDCQGGTCVVAYEDGSLGIDETGEVVIRALIK